MYIDIDVLKMEKLRAAAITVPDLLSMVRLRRRRRPQEYRHHSSLFGCAVYTAIL